VCTRNRREDGGVYDETQWPSRSPAVGYPASLIVELMTPVICRRSLSLSLSGGTYKQSYLIESSSRNMGHVIVKRYVLLLLACTAGKTKLR
jgi:hypothetical protein